MVNNAPCPTKVDENGNVLDCPGGCNCKYIGADLRCKDETA
jgi:hypothetical protein